MRGVSITHWKKKDGTYNYAYRFDIAPVNGKRKQISKSGFKSKKEAEKAGIVALLQYENSGQTVTQSDMSFSDYLDLWMEKDCKIELKETTILNYQKRIKNQIKPVLGGYRLSTISREKIQAFITDLYDNGMSINSISSIKGILTKSFNYAVDNNYLNHSPADRIRIPKNRVPKVPTNTVIRETITDDNIRLIFKRFPVGNSSHIPLRLGFECGLRIGEAFALVWDDIDFENKAIHIKRQIQWSSDKERTLEEKLLSNGSNNCGNGYWYFENPKYNSFRTITISDGLLTLLRQEKQRQEIMREYYQSYYIGYYSKFSINDCKLINPITTDITDNSVNFVCVRADGSYISSRTIQYTSRIIRKEIDSGFSFHCLRHTHASILYEAGLNDKYISERLGHKNTKITKDTYIHLTESAKALGDETINKLFNL